MSSGAVDGSDRSLYAMVLSIDFPFSNFSDTAEVLSISGNKDCFRFRPYNIRW